MFEVVVCLFPLMFCREFGAWCCLVFDVVEMLVVCGGVCVLGVCSAGFLGWGGGGCRSVVLDVVGVHVATDLGFVVGVVVGG